MRKAERVRKAGEKGETALIIVTEGGKAGYRSYSIHYTKL